jgi:hypothetical protein
VSSSKGNETYTLSVYNRANKYNRPFTAPTTQDWMKGFEKLPPVPEEDAVSDNRLPDFKAPAGFNMLNRNSVDGHRLE